MNIKQVVPPDYYLAVLTPGYIFAAFHSPFNMSLSERKEGGVIAGSATEVDPQLLTGNPEEPESQADRQHTEAEKRLARLQEQYGATWDGPDDPEDPYNWPEWRKVVMGVIFSVGQLVTLMSASIIAAALDNISRDLGTDASTTQITLSIYFLGLGVGPFFIAALCEMNGRKNIWIVSNIWYILWNALCPVGTSRALMIIGRFLSATGAAAGVIVRIDPPQNMMMKYVLRQSPLSSLRDLSWRTCTTPKTEASLSPSPLFFRIWDRHSGPSSAGWS